MPPVSNSLPSATIKTMSLGTIQPRENRVAVYLQVVPLHQREAESARLGFHQLSPWPAALRRQPVDDFTDLPAP